MIQNHLDENYKELLKYKLEKDKKNELTICPAIKGYKELDKKYKSIMFIGRSINSWCSLSNDNNYNLEQISYCEDCKLDWMIGINRNAYCNDKCKVKKEKGILKNTGKVNSRFINMMKDITMTINKGLTEEDWFKSVIWNNLYKLSYKVGGNPKGYYDQNVICDKILVEDLKKYHPNIIVFITEKQSAKYCTWFNKKDFPNTYEHLITYDGDIFITKRPEYKKKEEVIGGKIISKEAFKNNIKIPTSYIYKAINKYVKSL